MIVRLQKDMKMRTNIRHMTSCNLTIVVMRIHYKVGHVDNSALDLGVLFVVSGESGLCYSEKRFFEIEIKEYCSHFG